MVQQLSPRRPVVLVACGSFNPPTLAHLRMFDLAEHALAEVRCAVLANSVIKMRCAIFISCSVSALASRTKRTLCLRRSRHIKTFCAALQELHIARDVLADLSFLGRLALRCLAGTCHP